MQRWKVEIRKRYSLYSIEMNRDLKLNWKTWKFVNSARLKSWHSGFNGGWRFISRMIEKLPDIFRPLFTFELLFPVWYVNFAARCAPGSLYLHLMEYFFRSGTHGDWIVREATTAHNQANKNAKALMLELQLKKASLFDNLDVNFVFSELLLLLLLLRSPRTLLGSPSQDSPGTAREPGNRD